MTRVSCTCRKHGGKAPGPTSTKRGFWGALWSGLKGLKPFAGPACLTAAGFTVAGVRAGSLAASIQSLFYKGSTSGLFSKLQSLGAVGVKGAAFVTVALCLPYAAWCGYKALYSDGSNPELWQALEECACARAQCDCDCDDDCTCACKRRRRGLWSRIKAFFCSSTFVDCVFMASFVGLGFIGWDIIKSIKRNFLY
ncbi:hypothetical protein C8Q76DRAFT_795397 [Earliella scabrosa]|nr:hypothetical protein C8Q76DRAFT_795397 [Earliella scabrosa]